uniref:Ankyrin repeat domain-containing proteinic-like isoform X1 n=2 Tax=Rhizophora mucronata TaxID=61149 RepID=A0A2P2JDA1_RHIMU
MINKRQAITSFLLRESASPFVRDTDGATVMHYAVQMATFPAIKLLLLYNVDINLQDNDGWAPLHLAVQSRRADVVKFLLIKGADKTLKNKDGLTPLDICLHSGRSQGTFVLIKLLKQFPKKPTALRQNPIL